MKEILLLLVNLVAPHQIFFDGVFYDCAIGRSGIIQDKKEGDGGTPIGEFYLKKLYYRADKMPKPETMLPTEEITPDLGWCDDSSKSEYNKPIKLPFEGSHEEMWRKDDLYDLVVELDHNANPPVPENGSAVFIHVAREGYSPTAGCIALKKEDLLQILRECSEKTKIVIHPENHSVVRSFAKGH